MSLKDSILTMLHKLTLVVLIRRILREHIGLTLRLFTEQSLRERHVVAVKLVVFRLIFFVWHLSRLSLLPILVNQLFGINILSLWPYDTFQPSKAHGFLQLV